jgi:hypothetical protein
MNDNPRTRKPPLVATLAFAIIVITIVTGGSFAMGSKVPALKWEWPAGRAVETKLLVQVRSISKASKGFLGIGASPSFADALPDATDIVASVVAGPAALLGSTVSLRVPGAEVKTLAQDRYAALGLVNNDTICTCIAAAPTDNLADAQTWLRDKACVR